MAVGEDYGGPAYLGPSQKVSTTALASGSGSTALVAVTAGAAASSPFQQARFVLRASGAAVYLRQGSAATVTNALGAGSFVLDTGVYWPVDVDRPERRFIGYAGVTGGGELTITLVSDTEDPLNVFGGT